jgi:hypothetical protein
MSQALLPYVPLLIAAVLLFRRTQKPRVIRPSRLWIAPAVLLLLATFYTVGAVYRGPHVHWTDILIIAGTAVAGVALGALRAHSVRLVKHPDTGAIEATLSAWGGLMLLVWLGGRIALRESGMVATATVPFGLYTDSAMALAVGAVLAQAIVLTRRCQAVEAESQSPPSTASSPITS